ncbi:YkgJ family cysteine cluster protein [Parachlamydia sp. AcF125]|uniref:YkgJ family cysteine cluster protein n=1 Tax=Parachlamydia sp. AcF125 TaxID=2795736 RepID=UPI00201688AF|nr:YkgJ family cysteine cluster protein [Parachlamydia sp. AcF125]
MFNEPEKEPLWYTQGLSFECTGCGQCCTGAPGYVWISAEEISLLASHLNLSLDQFSEKYLRKVGNRFSLREHPQTFDCVFLKDKKCEVYAFRPKQCRTFPWWPQLLKSRKDWEEAAIRCEGMRSNAPAVPFETIQHQLSIQASL